MDSNLYFEQKRTLLKECVSVSENILSNIDDMEKVNELLAFRAEKITKIQEFEKAYQGQTMMASLPDKQKSQINQLVSLILDLDRDTEMRIKAAQEELKQTMKINTQNHKMIQYAGKIPPASGKLLDKKK